MRLNELLIERNRSMALGGVMGFFRRHCFNAAQKRWSRLRLRAPRGECGQGLEGIQGSGMLAPRKLS